MLHWTTLLLGTLILVLAGLTGCDIMAGSKLEGAVLSALKDDPRTSSYKFEVSLQNPGEVLITGEVSGPEVIDAVTEVAGKVDGVTSVVNRCSVPEDSSGMMQDTVVPGVGGGLAF